MSYLQEKAAKTIESYADAIAQVSSDLRKAQLIDWSTMGEDELLKILPVLDALDKAVGSIGIHSVALILLDAIANPKESV